MRPETGSRDGHESREGPGTSFPWRPWTRQSTPTPRYPLPHQGRCPSNPSLGPSPLPSQPPRCALRGGGWGPHLVSVVQGARAGLPMGPAGPHRLQVALRRGRGPGLTGRPPGALQPMALGPAAPAHSVPGTFSRRGSWRRTGRRVRASEHARRGHARGGRTGRSAWGSTRAGSRGHGDTRPLQRPRVAPGHARGSGRRRPAARAPGAAAAHSPWHRRARPRVPWRPGIPHRPGACRRCANRHSAASQTKRQLPGPFTISQRWESLSHVAGHPPQHTHTCPHTHTSPHPQAGPGANPHCCWDPRFTDTL